MTNPADAPLKVVILDCTLLYTNKTARYLAHNVVWMARLHKANPIPTNLRQLIAEAEV
jgi:hypothetical protein